MRAEILKMCEKIPPEDLANSDNAQGAKFCADCGNALSEGCGR
jgi:hypothetical protein